MASECLLLVDEEMTIKFKIGGLEVGYFANLGSNSRLGINLPNECCHCYVDVGAD